MAYRQEILRESRQNFSETLFLPSFPPFPDTMSIDDMFFFIYLCLNVTTYAENLLTLKCNITLSVFISLIAAPSSIINISEKTGVQKLALYRIVGKYLTNTYPPIVLSFMQASLK